MEENLYKPNKIRMSSGRYVDPFDMSIEDIDIKDIARGLSRIYRFAGQSNIPISVAEHSIQCYHEKKERIDEKISTGNLGKKYFIHEQVTLLEHLLHDAAEAYIGDIPGPIKDRYYIVGKDLVAKPIKYYEGIILNLIAQKYYLPQRFNGEEYVFTDSIKEIDKMMLEKGWCMHVIGEINTHTSLSKTNIVENSFLYIFNELFNQIENHYKHARIL